MHIKASPLTQKLSAFVALSETELAVLERLHQRRKSFSAGRDLVYQGQSEQAAYILAAGWVVLSFPLKTGPLHWAQKGDIEWRGNDIQTKMF